MRRVWLLTSLCLASASPASATPIGLSNTLAEGTFTFNGGFDTELIQVLDAEFGFTSDFEPGSRRFSLFDFIDVTDEDAGRLLIATPLSAPDFDEVQTLLTNGMDNLFYFGRLFTRGTSITGGENEFRIFGRDFAGSQIDAIALRLDSITSVTVDSFTSQRIDGTLAVIGRAVPEPLETGLLGLGLALLAFARRARAAATPAG